MNKAEHRVLQIVRSLPLLAGLVAFTACASMQTQTDHYIETVPLAQEGSYLAAAEMLESLKGVAYQEKDRVLYWLDVGMLYHWAGEYEKSNEMLDKAELAIEELFTRSVSKALASGLLNDNALDYFGEDYEDIYINVFKALNYIGLGDQESALVEIRRVHVKLTLLEDKYKELVDEYNSSSDAEGELQARENRFYDDVLARYLSLLLYRADRSFDDARIDLEAIETAWRTQSQLYNFDMPAMPTAVPVDDGRALVNVVAFSGLGPIKTADTFQVDTGPNIVYITSTEQDEDYATRMVGFNYLIIPGVQYGTHFRIQFPKLTRRGTDADRIVVKLDGEEYAVLDKVESMENIARETFLLRLPLTIGKTIIRATIKNIAKEVGKDVATDALSDEFGIAGLLVGIVAGVAADAAVDATEQADLRISHFMPAVASAAEFAVEPGSYNVTTEYWNGKSLMRSIDHGQRSFQAGELNLVESFLLR